MRKIVEEVAKGQKLRLAPSAIGALHEVMEAFIVTQIEHESTLIYKLLLKSVQQYTQLEWQTSPLFMLGTSRLWLVTLPSSSGLM